MKGMVFTEYIEFVEDLYGFETAQEMIDNSNLSNDAVFTSIGTYDPAEFVTMVVELSTLVKVNVPDILVGYGKYLFKRFTTIYPHFFPEDLSLFDFISKIDDYIHVEVKKLYPDAELPKVETISKTDNQIEMVYSSQRKFGDFAQGLLLGAVDFFGDDVEMSKKLLKEDGSIVQFTITRKK